MTSLVYEKQQKLRIMMKMHGLGDGPYWMITYGYFLFVSASYMLCFVLFGSVIGDVKNLVFLFYILIACLYQISEGTYYVGFHTGLKFFTVNDYSVQFVFYFIYINLQISLAFLVAAMFSNVKTAAGMASSKQCYSSGGSNCILASEEIFYR